MSRIWISGAEPAASAIWSPPRKVNSASGWRRRISRIRAPAWRSPEASPAEMKYRITGWGLVGELVGAEGGGGGGAGMMPQLEKMLPKLDSILGSLNMVLADPAIPTTLHNVQTLTANLAVTSGQLQTLMNKDIPQLTGKLNTIGDNFVLISNNLKEIDYATAMQSIDSTLANVKMITDKLNRKDNTVGLLLNDPSLYNNLNATTANAASLLEDLKSHPKRYVHFSLFGKKDK